MLGVGSGIMHGGDYSAGDNYYDKQKHSKEDLFRYGYVSGDAGRDMV